MYARLLSQREKCFPVNYTEVTRSTDHTVPSQQSAGPRNTINTRNLYEDTERERELLHSAVKSKTVHTQRQKSADAFFSSHL